MLIAEDLLLLLTDDQDGKFEVDGTALNLVLAGACVVELAMDGRVDVAGEGEQVKKGRLVVRDDTRVNDPLLDDVLARCADRAGAKPQDVLGKIGKDIREGVLDRLIERGILRREEGRVLGIFPITRWPAVDSEHEHEVLDRLEAALVNGEEPDRRTASLAALLSAVDAAHKVVPAPDRKAVKKRAKEIRESEWAADAVGKAIEAVQAAVVATVAAGAAAAGAGSS